MTMEEREKQLAGLRRLFALSRDAVLVFRDGTAVYANDAAERLLGRTLTGAEGNALFPGLFPLPEEDSFVTAVTVRGTVCSAAAVREGEMLILTLPRPEAPSGLTGGAVLSRMRMAAFQLRMRLDEAISPEAGEQAGALYRSYYRLLHLVEELSDADALARREMPFRPESVELCSLAGELADSAAFFCRRDGVEIRCSIPDGECFVAGDPDRLEQLLLILLANALLHLPDGGSVTVGVRKDGKNVILSVDDNGTGMTEEAMAYAFSLRETPSLPAAVSGAGMGLYIAQGIAALHGGSILLTSRPGGGTRVRCTLPGAESFRIRDASPRPARGPERLLTELSGVLPEAAYDKKLRE